MTLEEFVERIKKSSQHCCLYHFTDERNIPLIRKHGLLAKNEMRNKGFWPDAPSGNQWSWDADDRKGISNYVSLCMTQKHPMCYIATKEERISTARYLHIAPEVLLDSGVLFASDVANKADVQLRPIRDVVHEIDIEVLYSRTDWKNMEIQSRLRIAEKYEVLVPKYIPLTYIPWGC